MDEVDKRLTEAEERAVEPLARLDRLSTVEEELAATTREVQGFVAKVRPVADALPPAVESLRAVAAVTRQSDPAKLVEVVDEVRAKAADLVEEVQRNTEAAVQRGGEAEKRSAERGAALLQQLRDGRDNLLERIDQAEASLKDASGRTVGLIEEVQLNTEILVQGGDKAEGLFSRLTTRVEEMEKTLAYQDSVLGRLRLRGDLALAGLAVLILLAVARWFGSG